MNPALTSGHRVSASARQGLAEFLRRNRQRAIAEWEHAVRGIPAAALLEADEVRDHIPALMDRVLGFVEGTTATAAEDVIAEVHAIERMQEGFSLEQIAWEYSALRSTLLRLNEEEGSRLEAGALVVLNDAIDRAVLRAIGKYHRARLRTLEALDRIAHEGLTAEPGALDALLHRLLTVIVETAEAVDTAVLFLREWDRLVLHAAVGLEEPLERRFSLAIGEGFAGEVAARRQPLFTHSAETDPRVKNAVLRMNGVRALYGVPLLYGDELIGVAKMGSRTAVDFAVDDCQILRSTAERAAAFIAQRRVSEERELVVHSLGHDLRSPLNTIVFGAGLLAQRESLPPAAERNVERMRRAALRMDQIIGNLTDYTKARATGTLPLNRAPVDMNEIARALVADLQPQHPDRELRLELAGDAAGEWDHSRLSRVASNLVNNAVAYGAPGTPVTIGVDAEDGWVTLRVHNEGAPIPPELLPQLFEAFTRGTSGSGTGLGLYIVQRVARAHGGSVDVDSAPGRGTTFRVRLPRQAP